MMVKAMMTAILTVLVFLLEVGVTLGPSEPFVGSSVVGFPVPEVGPVVLALLGVVDPFSVVPSVVDLPVVDSPFVDPPVVAGVVTVTVVGFTVVVLEISNKTAGAPE